MPSFRLNRISWLSAAAGFAIAVGSCAHPSVTLRVIAVQTSADSASLRCEIQNHGSAPVEFYIHALDRSPCYRWLQRVGDSWMRSPWDIGCGIDLVPTTLAPGQALVFSAPIGHGNIPARLALDYRQRGKNRAALTGVFTP